MVDLGALFPISYGWWGEKVNIKIQRLFLYFSSSLFSIWSNNEKISYFGGKLIFVLFGFTRKLIPTYCLLVKEAFPKSLFPFYEKSKSINDFDSGKHDENIFLLENIIFVTFFDWIHVKLCYCGFCGLATDFFERILIIDFVRRDKIQYFSFAFCRN